jgi:hypothetical protein
VQGFRRCQGLLLVKHLSSNGYALQYRELYKGPAVFSHAPGKLSYEHPQTEEEKDGGLFDLEVDVNDGSFYWRYNRQPLLDETGDWVRDGKPMWVAQNEGGGSAASAVLCTTTTVAS